VNTPERILVRATNWVGDAVMSLPALAAVRQRFPEAHICVLARPWVAGLYRSEPFADEIISYHPRSGLGGVADRWAAARKVREGRFDCALLLQNAFDAALIAWMAGIPRRIGYSRDGRGLLLTEAVAVPEKGEIPPHESFYYLELLRRAGWTGPLPAAPLIRLAGAERARAAGRERFEGEGWGGPIIGLSPGAAFGTAKQWLPERFADAAAALARRLDARVALFGSGGERPLCETVMQPIESAGIEARNFAGQTTLEEFIERAAACVMMLTNDSGAMHIASALGVRTVTVFGATNHVTTGPTGPLARVVRVPVDCAPCQLRHCPIDHRCMTGVTASMVVAAAGELIQLK
jgi:heptosyltransferase-2